MRSSRGRAGGVRRFERDEDGTGAGYGQRTRSSREPVSRLAGTGRRPGACGRASGRVERRRVLRAVLWPLPSAVGEGRGRDPARAGQAGGSARARLGGARSPLCRGGGASGRKWGLLLGGVGAYGLRPRRGTRTAEAGGSGVAVPGRGPV